MNERKKLKISAKPYNELVKSNQNRATTLSNAVEIVLVHLRDSKAPFVTPREIAPLLGINAPALRYHARNCKALNNWTGRFEFQLDDAEHVAALRSLVTRSMWSLKVLPEWLRPPVH